MSDNDYLHFRAKALHKIKSPLTIIRESLSLIYDGTTGTLNPDQNIFIETALKNTDRLTQMITDIYEYESLFIDEHAITIQPVKLKEIMSETLRTIKDNINRWNVAIVFQPELDTRTINANKNLLILAMKKIILNAIQFSPSSSIIIECEQTSENHTISVIDKGIGIKREHLSEIRKPFTRFTTSNVILEGGAGLGLAIVERIIALHGGLLDISSEYKNGTRVCITLPIH